MPWLFDFWHFGSRFGIIYIRHVGLLNSSSLFRLRGVPSFDPRYDGGSLFPDGKSSGLINLNK